MSESAARACWAAGGLQDEAPVAKNLDSSVRRPRLQPRLGLFSAKRRRAFAQESSSGDGPTTSNGCRATDTGS